jgi:hypothetical protein
MRIFISYRRGDAVALAGRLYDRLSSRIGADSVFMDQESVPIGQNFQQAISRAITQSDVLLVLIGPRWLELLERLSASPDFVVEEISTALKQDIPVIPVLLGDTSMPEHAALPSLIQGLAMRQALKLEPGERFSSDFERLMRALPVSGRLKSSLIERIRKWLLR